MIRLIVLLAAVPALWSLIAPGAPRAYACSPDPGYDPISDSDVIVAGRFQGWQEANDLAIVGDFTPVRVSMTVDRVFKGDALEGIEIIDTASLISYGGEGAWAGGDDSCGAFDADPTGMYGILGLNKVGDDYEASILSRLFIGAEPQGQIYDTWLARLESIGEEFPWLPATIVAVLGPLAFIFASSFVFRARHSGG